MSSWNKIKEHGGVIAIIALIIGGFWHMDTKFDRLNDKMTDVMVRLERHDIHIQYLMTGKVPIQAPEKENG